MSFKPTCILDVDKLILASLQKKFLANQQPSSNNNLEIFLLKTYLKVHY